MINNNEKNYTKKNTTIHDFSKPAVTLLKWKYYFQGNLVKDNSLFQKAFRQSFLHAKNIKNDIVDNTIQLDLYLTNIRGDLYPGCEQYGKNAFDREMKHLVNHFKEQYGHDIKLKINFNAIDVFLISNIAENFKENDFMDEIFYINISQEEVIKLVEKDKKRRIK